MPQRRPQDAQRLGRVGPGQVVEGDDVGQGREVREVGVDLDRVEVGHDEERRVLEGVAVALELEVGGLLVLLLALVFEGEEAALPHVGEAVAAPELLGPLLESVPGAGRVGLVRGPLTEEPAEVDEVLVRGGTLGRGDALPLRGELARCHRPLCVTPISSQDSERDGSVNLEVVAGRLVRGAVSPASSHSAPAAQRSSHRRASTPPHTPPQTLVGVSTIRPPAKGPYPRSALSPRNAWLRADDQVWWGGCCPGASRNGRRPPGVRGP